MGDGILCWRKDELLRLLEQFVISSSAPNESDMRGGMGNPDTVFRILLLYPEIAALFGDSGSSSEGKMRKKNQEPLLRTLSGSGTSDW